ncbi:uncharacterized protein PGTG_09196 [Puccinia graminis f. sp. tritici CRL 75-36-700-3]|uniref:Uncharacterized protein n=3 Tax=Puccinia graminis f. sp. tritici TaxID=56615 RepID=E3KFV8_PUCGT|nr:uncharacterized protein PGTG_09196 [Puccinia graminis f. sp. tritici CRL 75-36-700-3]EFP83243.1 hypothetical protein PGTG_09196 [Puccinia graminis f. sp. tritici CRL 75-36-700-3]
MSQEMSQSSSRLAVGAVRLVKRLTSTKPIKDDHHPVQSNPTQSTHKMINYLTNLPNRIPEKQRMFQGDHRLVHQKLPRARVYMGIYYTIFGASMLWSANGLYKLIRGKK